MYMHQHLHLHLSLHLVLTYDHDDDLDQLLGMDIDHQKRVSALYLMKMKEIHRLSQVAIDDIVEGSRSVFNHVVHRFRAGFTLNLLKLAWMKQA